MTPGTPEPPVEVELKYRLATLATGERLLDGDVLGPFSAKGPAKTSESEDRYIDTRDGALARAGFAGRLRRERDVTIVTIKSVAIADGSLQRRTEIEGPADPTLPPIDWPPSPARSFILELCGDALLVERVTVRQVRRKRLFRDDETVVELSLDAVEVIARARVVDRFAELEVELVRGPEQPLLSLRTLLDADGSLVPSTVSKLDAALAAVGHKRPARQGADVQEDHLAAPTDLPNQPIVPLVPASPPALAPEDGAARHMGDAAIAAEASPPDGDAAIAAEAPPPDGDAAIAAEAQRAEKRAAKRARKRDRAAKAAAEGAAAEGAPAESARAESASAEGAAAEGTAPDGTAPDGAPAHGAPADGAPAEGAAAPDPAAGLVVGRTPGVTAEDVVAEAGRKVLRFHLARLIAREAGTRSGEDPEELHAMRVATRRMRAAWRVFGDGFRPQGTRRYRTRLRDVAAKLGAVRDIDVLVLALEAYRAPLPAAERAALQPLVDDWLAEREAARAVMVRELDSNGYRRFVEDYRAFVLTPGAGALVVSPTEPHHVRDTAGSRIWHAYEGVLAYGPVLRWADVPTLHQLRIAGKWLRYTLEFVAEAMGPDAKALIERVVAMQDHLGLMNDAEVAAMKARALLVARSGTLTAAQAAAIARYLNANEREVARLKRGAAAVWRGVSSVAFRRALGRAVATITASPSGTSAT